MMCPSEYQSAEPLIEEPSKEEVEVALGKLKSYKAAGTDNIPTELFKAFGEAGVSKIHWLVKKIWENEKLPEECKESILILTKRPEVRL